MQGPSHLGRRARSGGIRAQARPLGVHPRGVEASGRRQLGFGLETGGERGEKETRSFCCLVFEMGVRGGFIGCGFLCVCVLNSRVGVGGRGVAHAQLERRPPFQNPVIKEDMPF
jgi:hypothetical protein